MFSQYLIGKFHSGNVYREGIHWNRKTKIGKGRKAECFSIQDEQTGIILALKEVCVWYISLHPEEVGHDHVHSLKNLSVQTFFGTVVH